MSYIGNQPTQVAFLTDSFSGDGTTTAFSLSASPANPASIIVVVHGLTQDPTTYSISGNTLNFSGAPPAGTGNISVRYMGIPASGVTTTAYRTLTEFTATAGQTTFTPPSYTVGFISVFKNGVRLGSADFTATNGTSVVLVSAASAGDLIATESFYVSSILNAIPNTAGAVQQTNLAQLTALPLSGGNSLTLPSSSMTIFTPEVDQWYLTTSTSAFTTEVDLTSNLSRLTKTGTGMTQSSGVFTFPSTGYWLVSGQTRFQASGAAVVYAYCRYNYSADSGSTWGSGPTPIVNMYNSASYAECFATHLLQVTNASTYRYKFSIGANNNSVLNGSTGELQTMFTFHKVAPL